MNIVYSCSDRCECWNASRKEYKVGMFLINNKKLRGIVKRIEDSKRFMAY